MAKAEIQITAKDKIQGAVNSVKAGLRSVEDQAKRLGLAVAAVSGATLAMTLRNNQLIDVQTKIADKLGVTTERLAGLSHAAEQTGASQEVLTKGLQKMVVNVTDAAKGIGEGKDALELLGLKATELKNLSPDQMFVKIAGATKGLSSQTDKLSVAYDLFGGRGTALLNTLDLGAAGLNAMQTEAEGLGIAISRVDAAKIEAANDAMDVAGKAVKGVFNTLSVEMSPLFILLAQRFTDTAKSVNDFGDEGGGALEFVSQSIGSVLDALRMMEIGWLEVQRVAINAAGAGVTALADWDKSLTNFLDKIPGVDAKPSALLENLSQSFQADTLAMNKAIKELKGLKKPSVGFLADADFERDKINKAAQAKADAVAKAQKDSLGSFSSNAPEDPKTLENEQQKVQRVIDMHQVKFDRIAEIANISALQDEDRITAETNKKLNALDSEFEFLASNDALNLEREQSYQDARAAIIGGSEARLSDLQKKGMTNLQKFEESSWKNKAITVAGALSGITANVASSNKTLFAINKASSAATAIIDTYQGATRALKDYPAPLSFAVAGAVVASGLAQLAKINSTSFGQKSASGGVSAPSISTPSNSNQGLATASGASNRPIINISIDDTALYSPLAVRRLMEQINNELDDGAQLNVQGLAA